MKTVNVMCFHGNEMTINEGSGVIAVRYLPTRHTNRIGICRCAIEINDLLELEGEG